jgi:transcriptional regulator with XRE-family HTH domain
MTLINIRKLKGYTAERMAKELGISRGHYSHLENGSRAFTNDIAEKISQILGISIDGVIQFAKEAAARNFVPNSWMLKIRIDNKPWLEAMLNDSMFLPLERNIKDDELIDRAVKYIAYRIEHSLKQETLENTELKNYIISRLRNTPTQSHRNVKTQTAET